MEALLHYCWKHRLFPLQGMRTQDGRSVEVVDPGLHNRNAGPDFFNAKVKIDGQLWVGNVEIHQRSSDWYAHGHHHDHAYNNVILHVCEHINQEVTTQQGTVLPQVEITVPEHVRDHYEQLLATDHYPPCYQVIPDLSPLTVHSWMSALQTERLEQKTEAITHRLQQAEGSWEQAFFITLARNFGFGINSDAFEQWAMRVPLQMVAHHRDDLLQLEAIFMGQAGLLDLDAMTDRHRQAAAEDDYFLRLHREYKYLSHKFSLSPIDAHLWRFLRLRPQNFPHIRLSQLALLLHEGRATLSQILECTTVKELQRLLSTQVTPYWETHFLFGMPSSRQEKRLSTGSCQLLIINTVVPVLFAYGRYRGKEDYCDRALDLWEQLRAERNHIVDMWQQCGLKAQTAGDSQALLQLKNEYCDRKDCLRCRIGYEYLKK